MRKKEVKKPTNQTNKHTHKAARSVLEYMMAEDRGRPRREHPLCSWEEHVIARCEGRDEEERSEFNE